VGARAWCDVCLVDSYGFRREGATGIGRWCRKRLAADSRLQLLLTCLLAVRNVGTGRWDVQHSITASFLQDGIFE
jgi:hypothetical protein